MAKVGVQESRNNYMPYFSSLSGVVAFRVLFPLLTLRLSLHSVLNSVFLTLH